MTSYAVTHGVAAPRDDVTYPVTPSLLGRKMVLGRRRCRARPGRNAGSTQRTLLTSTSRTSPSKKVLFSSQPLDFAANFLPDAPPGPKIRSPFYERLPHWRSPFAGPYSTLVSLIFFVETIDSPRRSKQEHPSPGGLLDLHDSTPNASPCFPNRQRFFRPSRFFRVTL
jgi:hypothetical protein